MSIVWSEIPFFKDDKLKVFSDHVWSLVSVKFLSVAHGAVCAGGLDRPIRIGEFDGRERLLLYLSDQCKDAGTVCRTSEFPSRAVLAEYADLNGVAFGNLVIGHMVALVVMGQTTDAGVPAQFIVADARRDRIVSEDRMIEHARFSMESEAGFSKTSPHEMVIGRTGVRRELRGAVLTARERRREAGELIGLRTQFDRKCFSCGHCLACESGG
jgi:hypothetical protein